MASFFAVFFLFSSPPFCFWRGLAEKQHEHVSWVNWQYLLSRSLLRDLFWNEGQRGGPEGLVPLCADQPGTGSVSSPCLQRANSPLDSPKGSCLAAGAVRVFLSPALKSGASIQEMQCLETTWDKPGVCGRKCRGRRVKDLNIILRLGRNSPRESEYSCFPPVCLWCSSTCSLSAEPKTIGGRAHGPLGMLAVPNSHN